MIGNVRVLCLTLALISGASMAGAASPSLSVILPRGGPQGATVDVKFVGANLSDAVDLVFHDPGIAVSELTVVDDKNVTAKLTIAPDCTLGPHPIRVRTRSGLTQMQLFSVGALAEVSETEPNNDPEQAQVVSRGTTVNGVVASEDADYFAVDLAAGDRLAVEVEAMRLGTALFDPKLRLFGPHGHELVTEDDTPVAHQDAAFVFVAEEAGRHLVAVSEASYGGAGNFYYRLHIGEFPRPLMATPLGATAGTPTEVTWLGDPGLTNQPVEPPAESVGTWRLAAHTDTGVSPTPVPFRVVALPGVREVEPNNDAGQASPGAVPGAFDGVIETEGDRDWFRFEGKKDQTFEFRVWARALGSPLDSVLALHKPDGGGLASDDDAAGVDSSFRATLPEDGTYTFYVQDHRGRGGPTFAYRVEVSPVERRLELRLLENDAARAVVHQGNQAFLLMQIVRQDFDGPIKLEFAGLPEGVTAAAPVVPAGQTTWPVVLSATAEAPATGALAEVIGSLEPPDDAGGVRGGLKQDVTLVEGPNRVVFYSWPVDRLAMAVAEPAPFSLEVVQPKTPLVRNGNKALKVIARRQEGFNEKIDLRFPWAPNGVGTGTAALEPEATETVISVDAQANAPVGVHSLALVGTAAGYTVATPFFTLEVAEPWTTFEVPNVETEQGKPVEIVVKVNPLQEYAGEFSAELLGLPKGVTAPAQPLSHGVTELRFPLEVAADAPEGKHGGLFVRTVLQAEGEDVLHQSGGGQLSIFKPLPPELQAPAEPPAETPQPEETKRKSRFASN